MKTYEIVLLMAILVCGYGCDQNLQIEMEMQQSRQLDTMNASCLEDCCANLQSRAPVTYYYYQNTGRFRGGNTVKQAQINTFGYSGQGQGYMNPDYQCKINGPLPASIYQVAFCKNVMHQITNRPCSFYLKPLFPAQVCGRDDFFIHGCQCCTPNDSTEPPAPGCSAGCVIISYENRKKIRIGDRLIVQSYEPKGEDENEKIQQFSNE